MSRTANGHASLVALAAVPLIATACNSIWGISDAELASPAQNPDASAGSGGAAGAAGASGTGGVGGAAGGTGGVAGGDGAAGQAGDGGAAGAGGQDADAGCVSGGCALWAHAYGDSTENQFALGLAADALGNAYVTGRFTGALPIGPGKTIVAPGGGDDVFWAKFGKDGAPAWSYASDSNLYQNAVAASVDENNNVAIAGWYRGYVTLEGPADAGTQSLPASTLGVGQPGFAAVFDDQGVPRKAIQVLDTTHTIELHGAASHGGKVVVAGWHDTYGDSTDYGPSTVVRQYDAVTGAQDWTADTANSTNWKLLHANAVALDPQGNAWVTGGYSGAFPSMGASCPALNPGDGDLFVLRLKSNGTCSSLQAFGNEIFNQFGEAVVVDSLAEATVCGSFQGQLSFLSDGGAKLNSGAQDADYSMFLVHFGAAGGYVWSSQFGLNTGSAFDCKLAADVDNNIYVAGVLTSPLTFGSDVLDPQGHFASFLAKFSQNGTYQWSRLLRSSDLSTSIAQGVHIQGVAAERAQGGQIFIAGYFAGSVDFGTGLLKAQGSLKSDIFVAAYAP